MLKALFLGVLVAVVALAVTAEKPKDKVVVLEVNGLAKKENSLKNLKLPKVNLKELNKKGEVFSTLKELKSREDFENLTKKEKRRLLKMMKKQALKRKRHRIIEKLKRKFSQKRKMKRQQKKEKKAFMKMLLKQIKNKRMLKKKAHKRHHKRGKNQKREKTPEKN